MTIEEILDFCSAYSTSLRNDLPKSLWDLRQAIYAARRAEEEE